MYTQEKPDLDTLTHWGVLGMKWGVRKKRSSKKQKLLEEANSMLDEKTKKTIIKGMTASTAVLAVASGVAYVAIMKYATRPLW